MGNRHLARSVVLQALFEWDFNNDLEAQQPNVADIVARDIEEFAAGMNDAGFVTDLVQGVLDKQKELDTVIEKAAPDWPIDKISTIDRNVLRIGLFELLFGDRKEVPAKVAINEAIELAKSFGGENSGRFVNGVLGAVYKELGEPGKDETSKRKKEVDLSKLPIKAMVGAVVYAKVEDEIFVALVHDVFGRWTLSKGKLKENEELTDAVVRKVQEEMGIAATPEDKLGENEYVANDPEEGKIRKQVNYFLAKAEYEELKLGESGGLDDAKWFRLADVGELNMYNDMLPIITKAINLLLSK
jgi:N utilization substance protein B